MIALWLSLAMAAEHRVVAPGDTVEGIAAELGKPGLAGALRTLNGLGEEEQPKVGAILWIPEGLDGHVDQPAVVLATRGPVVATAPGGTPTPALAGEELVAGSTLCTEAGGHATVRLAAAGIGDAHDDMTLFPDTCLTIDAASARGALRHSLVSMTRGSLSVRVTESPSGAVTVRTPAGVTSGSEGGFRVHVEPTAARTEALDAAARVFGAEQMLELEAGYGARVNEGEAPSEPVKLLAPGTPTLPVAGATLKRPDFEWVPVDRALGYRIQIASVPDFSDVLHLDGSGPPAWYPERLFLPTQVRGYWWRVASVDRTGFIGRWSAPQALLVPSGL